MYVGTSSAVSRRSRRPGLFKSTDGGNSWIQLGSGFPAGNTGNASHFIGQWINAIIVDPSNRQRPLSGRVGRVVPIRRRRPNWTAGREWLRRRALARCWTQPRPAASRILYAGISGRGVFRSNDGGQNWTQILSGATPAVAAAIGPSPNGFSKVIVALAPPTSPVQSGGIQVLYVSLEGTGGAPDPVGVFISTNQGGTWTQQAATGMPTSTQGGYSFHMAVDPASPGDGINDIIYFGTVGQAKSTNSGVSFTLIDAAARRHPRVGVRAAAQPHTLYRVQRQ